MEKSKVFFTKEITSENLIKIYEALGQEVKGKVAVKLSTGEAGGHYFLNPNLIKDLVHKVNGTIVECNTAYSGKRNTTKDHWETIKDHGFLDIAEVDIMDEEGDMPIPVENGVHLKENMADLGIFASLDPVALDQACYDAVVNAKDEGKKALIERMDSRHGIHTVEAANKLGLGSREYEIVNI